MFKFLGAKFLTNFPTKCYSFIIISINQGKNIVNELFNRTMEALLPNNITHGLELRVFRICLQR